MNPGEFLEVDDALVLKDESWVDITVGFSGIFNSPLQQI
jgi:hypothetical protein